MSTLLSIRAYSSNIGMRGGEQTLSIASFPNFSVIIHELGHVLGFYHEHTRPDRDDYVEIKFENIKDNHRHNFWKRNSERTQTLGPYDYNSIMHYRGQVSEILAS